MNKDELIARLPAKYEFINAVAQVTTFAGPNQLVAVVVTSEVPVAQGRDETCETHIGLGPCGEQAFIDLLGKLGAV